MATEATIELHAGVQKAIDITHLDGATPVDITTAAIMFVVAYGPGVVPALITKTVGSGVTITNGPAGIARVLLEPDDTEDLPPGRYYFESRVTEAGPIPWIGAYGTLTLLPSST